MKQIDQNLLGEAMSLLGNLMAGRKRPPLHLVVCGGSALIALNLVVRTTKDVDVLATLAEGQLRCARPLPEWLIDDADAVRSELSLPEHWLNDGPADETSFASVCRLASPDGLCSGISAPFSKSALLADTTQSTSSSTPQRIRAGVISPI